MGLADLLANRDHDPLPAHHRAQAEAQSDTHLHPLGHILDGLREFAGQAEQNLAAVFGHGGAEVANERADRRPEFDQVGSHLPPLL